MEVRALSPALGAELGGIDLRAELSSEDAAAIMECFRRDHLLLFRDQDLAEEDQVRLAERFGPISSSSGSLMKGGKKSLFVSNTVMGVFPEGEILFHLDRGFQKHPLKASMLYALEVTSTGGETIFVNARKAYEALSPRLKARISNLHALQISSPTQDQNTQGNRRYSSESDTVLRYEHPIAWPHPETGLPILFVNELMTEKVCELSPDESAELLAELYRHLYRDEFSYKHKWQVGDAILWDNRVLQHARTNFDPAEKRTLRRVTVEEPVPVAAE